MLNWKYCSLYVLEEEEAAVFFPHNKHKENGFMKLLFLYGQLYSQYEKEEKNQLDR